MFPLSRSIWRYHEGRHAFLRNAPLVFNTCYNGLHARQETIMNVFDRNAKRIQRNRSCFDPEYSVYEYLREEIGWRVADRICDVKRKFDVAVDMGCGRGYVSRHVYDDMVGTLYQMEMAEKMLEQAQKSPEVPTFNVICDEEFFPFKPKSLDLVTSSLSLHWVNDLPGVFKQIRNALKNDGCFLGSMFGGETLFELRVALQLAEQEREGGFAPHVSPFTSIQDLGNLLSRAGYVLTAIDIDEMVINYPSMFELMADLKGMAENNCAWNRRLRIPKDTLMAAAAIYKEMYGKPDEESVPATFQIINFIGWTPDPSQRPAAKRGSGQVSMKEISRVDEIVDQIEKLHAENKASTNDARMQSSVDELSEKIEKLRLKTLELNDSNNEEAPNILEKTVDAEQINDSEPENNEPADEIEQFRQEWKDHSGADENLEQLHAETESSTNDAWLQSRVDDLSIKIDKLKEKAQKISEEENNPSDKPKKQ